MVTVCTVLPPPERPRIDAAGDGCFDTLHADSLREAIYVARRRRVDAMVISVHRCHGEALPGVARFVREFPAIPAVALVSRHDREATETLLRLGATGVRTAVDCTEAAGCATCWATRRPPSRRASWRAWFPRWVTRRVTSACFSRRWRASRRCCPPCAASRAICESVRARSCRGSTGRACLLPRPISLECACCTPLTSFSTRGSRSATWRTDSTIRRPRASVAT